MTEQRRQMVRKYTGQLSRLYLASCGCIFYSFFEKIQQLNSRLTSSDAFLTLVERLDGKDNYTVNSHEKAKSIWLIEEQMTHTILFGSGPRIFLLVNPDPKYFLRKSKFSSVNKVSKFIYSLVCGRIVLTEKISVCTYLFCH